MSGAAELQGGVLRNPPSPFTFDWDWFTTIREMKKIALKYGLIITLGVMAWVIIAHILVPDPQSPVHSLGAMAFFNILHFAGIYLGIAEYGRHLGERAGFKQSLKMGVWISFVYGVAAALFFVCVLMIVGTKWLAGEPGAQQLPIGLVALQAFTGLFLGTMLFGLVYSTLISFALAKRLPRSNAGMSDLL